MLKRFLAVIAVVAGLSVATPAVAQAGVPAGLFAGQKVSVCMKYNWDFGRWFPCGSRYVD